MRSIWVFIILGGLLVSCSLIEAEPIPDFYEPAYDFPQYNIILIVTDDQRWDTLDYMPNVQRLLVDQGVLFTNAFTTTPHCCPTRASILTGLYAHNHGVLQNFPPNGSFFAFDDSFSVSIWMDQAGYTTGLIGKYLNRYNYRKNDGYVPPGWDVWASNEKSPETNNSSDYFNYEIFLNGQVSYYWDAPEDYGPDVLAGIAVDFIREHSGETPFFLYFAPPSPHSPAVPAPRHAGFFDEISPWRPPSFNQPQLRGVDTLTEEEIAKSDAFRIAQLTSLLAVDDAVAAIVSALEESGELEDTVIVFTSDHGYLWGEHALVQLKATPYDESLRVPLVVRFPGLTPTPKVLDEFVLLFDLAPTFTEIAGLGSPHGIDGVSIIPLVLGDSAQWRQGFLFERWEGEDALLTEGIITHEWKLVAMAGGYYLLFDRTADPYELENLAENPDYFEVIERLLDQMDRYREGTW